MKRFLFGGTVALSLLAFTNPVQQTRPFFSPSKVNHGLQDTIPVKIQLEQRIINDMHILFIIDTAATNEAIAGVFGKDYGELMKYVQQHHLQPLKFIAFYRTTRQPWLVDVAVEVNQMPAELTGRVQSRTQKGGKVVIAHIWGPYNQVGKAYLQIQKWLKENNRKATEAPFEVYVNDPSVVKDPSKIQTDVYQPID